MSSPAFVNSWNRAAMRRIRSLPDDPRLRLLDAIPRKTRNTIARTSGTQWLPAEVAIEICDALVEILGPEPSVEFWRELVHDSWIGGLLEPLARELRAETEDAAPAEAEIAAPASLLNLAPAAWAMSSRDCGEIVVVDKGDGRIELEARDLPESVRHSQGIRSLYAGALQAMLRFSKLSARVRVEDNDDRLAFVLRMG